MPEGFEKLLTPKQAADILGLKAQTLANMRHASRGPRYLKLCGNGAIRYTPTDLKMFMEENAIIPSECDRGRAGR